MIVRAMKLGLMAVLGYAAFQFIRGILEGEEAVHFAGSPASTPSRSGGETLTGGGGGRVVTTIDPVGTSVPHRVGRGVVHR